MGPEGVMIVEIIDLDPLRVWGVWGGIPPILISGCVAPLQLDAKNEKQNARREAPSILLFGGCGINETWCPPPASETSQGSTWED